MGRQRQTTATRLRLVAQASDEAVTRVAERRSPDPRLVALVRQLARQAARDFVQQEANRQPENRFPE